MTRFFLVDLLKYFVLIQYKFQDTMRESYKMVFTHGLLNRPLKETILLLITIESI